MQRIGVFGASFNPPTLGHFNVLSQASPLFDSILLVPSLAHAFGKVMLPISHRLAMLSLFVQNWEESANKTKVLIDNIEEIIQKNNEGKPIYTFDVLTAISEKYQKEGIFCEISFIIGPDNYQQEIWRKFYRYQDIEKNWPLFIAKKEVDISSSSVREIIRTHQGESIALRNKLAGLVQPNIINYIIEKELYRTP